jgi:leucyl-tRNA---protein transferase
MLDVSAVTQLPPTLQAHRWAGALMDVLRRFSQGPNPCSYLGDRESILEYEWVAGISPEEYEQRMNSGWRKFGALLFHPTCAACTGCRPIRVPVAEFAPDRSQRRSLKANADLKVRVAAPVLDVQRMDLYHRYHEGQTGLRGWKPSSLDGEDYAFQFVENPLPSAEISIWEGDVLRAIVLVDVTPTVISAIYHFHDPAFRERGLGTFAILQTIALARQMDKAYVYLGYYVAGCASMEYKLRFRPNEILHPDGVWRGVEFLDVSLV